MTRTQPEFSLIFIALALISLSEVSLATSVTQRFPSTSTSNNEITPESTTCGFAGDDNAYGLGIRIGIYLQWITSSFAYNFVPEEAVTMRGVNSCFQLANFAGLLFITFTKGNDQPGGGIYAVEIWIVLSLCIGGVFSARTVDQDDKPPTFIAHEMSFIGRLIELGLTAAVTYYSIWFIYIGMDAMQAPPCSRYAFFFAKVDLYHWFRTMQKVFFTIAAVLCSILLMFTFASFITCTRASGFRKTLGHIFGFQPGGTDDEVDNGRMPPEKTKLTLRSVNLSSTAFIFFIVSTELVIKWNHIEGVHNMGSTGQLLPVVIGGGSFIRVLWRFLVKIINGDYQIDDSNFTFSCFCFYSERTTEFNHRWSES